VSVLRYTVVDDAGTVSFVGPGHAMKMLAAACAREPGDVRSLLDAAGRYDAVFAKTVLDGLSIFDELNTAEDHAASDAQFAEIEPKKSPPFRVLNEAMRNRSLEPVGAGLVVYNLPARRIIQVQNSYAELQRQGRGRHRENGRPVQRLYHYKLPESWSILP
jgi:hypothetical protein